MAVGVVLSSPRSNDPSVIIHFGCVLAESAGARRNIVGAESASGGAAADEARERLDVTPLDGMDRRGVYVRAGQLRERPIKLGLLGRSPAYETTG